MRGKLMKFIDEAFTVGEIYDLKEDGAKNWACTDDDGDYRWRPKEDFEVLPDTPQPGQWLVMKLNPKYVVFFVGMSSDGKFVLQWQRGSTSLHENLEYFRQEPRCTGFDWVKTVEESWPKYAIRADGSDFAEGGYIRRDSKTECVYVNREGIAINDSWAEALIEQGVWIYCTEAEALAKVKRQTKKQVRLWIDLTGNVQATFSQSINLNWREIHCEGGFWVDQS